MRVRGEIFAVEMGRQHNPPRRVWVFCGYDVCKPLLANWCNIRKLVFVYVPVKRLEGGDNVIANKGIVVSFRCAWVTVSRWPGKKGVTHEPEVSVFSPDERQDCEDQDFSTGQELS